MAKQLIESLTSDFKPGKYRDEYREELLDLLERKAAGKEVVSAPTEEPKPTKAPDLMAALEESLAAVKGEEAATDGKGNEAKAKPKSSSRAKSPPKSKSSCNGREDGSRKKSQGLLASCPIAARRSQEADQEVTVGNRRLEADQPGQGPLPEDQDHQGGGDRLLRAGRGPDPVRTSRAGRSRSGASPKESASPRPPSSRRTARSTARIG